MSCGKANPNEKLGWLRQYRPFANGIPVDDTIARVVRALDPGQFNRAFISWVPVSG